jgi:sulfur carrier protein ThiS
MAVRIAQQSVEDGRSSTTVDQWLELAMRWQRAADLMAQVPANDSRYAVAQDRIAVYSANKQRALEEAKKRKP